MEVLLQNVADGGSRWSLLEIWWQVGPQMFLELDDRNVVETVCDKVISKYNEQLRMVHNSKLGFNSWLRVQYVLTHKPFELVCQIMDHPTLHFKLLT